MKNNHSVFFIFAILLLFSCGEPVIPAYLVLSVEDFTNCIDVSDYNSAHDQNYDPKELDAIAQQNFTDVLVSLNGKELGYRQLPCTIPLLPNYSGRNNIRVIPCVRTPNTSTTTLQYPFVTPIEEFFEMQKEKEYQLSDFKLKYLSSVDFSVIETFEQSTDFIPRVPNEFPATMEILYDKELQKNIGSIILVDSSVFFDIVTPYFPLQGNGERQFWEISYNTTNGRMVTHLGFENSITMAGRDMVILPSTEGVWKKVYIDITNTVREASYTASQVSTRLRITGIKNDASIGSEYFFENIKLITMYAPYY